MTRSSHQYFISFVLASRHTKYDSAGNQSKELTGVQPSTAFERECVEFFAEVVHFFGVPKSVGQIYGLLYASPEALSFSDIIERLDMSKGSASQGLQLLRALGAIYAAGLDSQMLPLSSRLVGRISYKPELSLRRLLSGVLNERIAPMALTGSARIARMRELAEQGGCRTSFYLDRAKQLNTWRRRLKTIPPVLTALLGRKK
jgi:HTH-type transcriptional regulator, glycine betaine synthesis regulator